jgi:hypothetical protein
MTPSSCRILAILFVLSTGDRRLFCSRWATESGTSSGELSSTELNSGSLNVGTGGFAFSSSECVLPMLSRLPNPVGARLNMGRTNSASSLLGTAFRSTSRRELLAGGGWSMFGNRGSCDASDAGIGGGDIGCCFCGAGALFLEISIVGSSHSSPPSPITRCTMSNVTFRSGLLGCFLLRPAWLWFLNRDGDGCVMPPVPVPPPLILPPAALEPAHLCAAAMSILGARGAAGRALPNGTAYDEDDVEGGGALF